MSSSSLANFSNVLGSVKDESATSHEPISVILRLLREGMIPVSDLADRTRLSSEVILDTIERLRALQQVEIVEIPDAGNRKFIRLTTAGYAVFAA